MKWKDFRHTDLFKCADIVICKRKDIEVSPRPFDRIITVYPVKVEGYLHLNTICVEIF